jgi:membrane protein
MRGVVGKAGVEQIDTMMDAAKKEKRGVRASVIGIAVLLFGATGVVAQLQYAFNKIWNVKPDPRAGGIKQFVFKRILSFAMILAIAFLLLVSLVLTTVLSAFGERVGTWLPKDLSKGMLLGLDFAVSLAVASVLFAAMCKWLPDAKVAWRDAILGGFLTGLLFLVGKFLLGLYLGHQDPTAYGPAAALVLILIWTYYSSMIVFLGAEFTQVWARRHGRQIVPSPGAIRTEDCPGDSPQVRPALG